MILRCCPDCSTPLGGTNLLPLMFVGVGPVRGYECPNCGRMVLEHELITREESNSPIFDFVVQATVVRINEMETARRNQATIDPSKPGSAGGKALVAKRGREYMAEIGRRGAIALHARYRLVPIGTSDFALVDRETGQHRASIHGRGLR